jgi:hypothetical protein
VEIEDKGEMANNSEGGNSVGRILINVLFSNFCKSARRDLVSRSQANSIVSEQVAADSRIRRVGKVIYRIDWINNWNNTRVDNKWGAIMVWLLDL